MKSPDFDIAFSIGKFHIYWYAILLALGIAVAMMITDRRTRGRSLPKDIALDLCILGVPFGILGARIFACLSGAVSWSDFLDLTHSGLSFFGGVFFATAAILVYLKLRKISVSEMLDTAAPGVFAGIGIAVWGDFFNRAHYGPLVEKSSHKWFPLATFGNDLRIHYAAFFYEFLLCGILILVYYVLLRKLIQKQGDRFLLMVLIYCLGCFCIDAIRQDIIMVGSIAFDQICEIILSVVCLLLLLLKRKAKPTTETSTDPVADPPEAEEEGKQEPAEPSTQSIDEEKEREQIPSEATEEDTFTGLN